MYNIAAREKFDEKRGEYMLKFVKDEKCFSGCNLRKVHKDTRDKSDIRFIFPYECLAGL